MAFPTTPVLDNFNRADSPTLGANWTADPYNFGHTSCNVTANQCGGAANESDYWNVQQFGPDCESYISFSVLDPTEYNISLRLQTPATPGVDGYVGFADFTTAPDTNSVQRIDNGVFTILGATVSQDWANGDACGLEAIGSTITLYRQPSGGSWGSLVARTDATYGTAGFIAAPYVTNAATRLDDFGGGTVIATPTGWPAQDRQLALSGGMIGLRYI